MSTAPALTVDDVTITSDHGKRLHAVVPDAAARLIYAASKEGIDPEARGMFFESARHPADSWVAAAVRTVFEAVIASPLAADDVHAYGTRFYRDFNGGTLYGFIVGVSAWDAANRRLRTGDSTRDLIIVSNATIATNDRRSLAGTCTFTI
ncbi:hypothetical protein ACFWCA_19115 [Streptomyces phaeochromogenes]|uniref:hypothetical protein n=1 Tax=Streptomyces phaeochromogenes TaxID=1923 RepID=UPI0036C86E85